MKRILCLLLAVLMLLTLAACGEKDVSGLGSLSMDDTDKSESGGIGTLGQPTEAPAPDPVPAPAETPAPAPAETPAPTETPAPVGLQTEFYSCELFTATIPAGWNVSYQSFDAGGGMMRIVVFVTDPADSNNMIFFATALEPFFESAAAKNAYVPYNSQFEWAPVLDTLSTESILRSWGSLYTLMEIQKAQDPTLMLGFKNYAVQQILGSMEGEGNTANDIVTATVAEVAIPGAMRNYTMFYESHLQRTSSPLAYDYFISYNNMGFVVTSELFDNATEELVICKNSFDFSGFRSQYSADANAPESLSNFPDASLLFD